eukprot:6464632-Amphidinium_carterae.1
MADRIPYATTPWSATRRRLMMVQEHMEEGNDETMPRMPDYHFDPPVDNHDHYPHGYDRAANAEAALFHSIVNRGRGTICCGRPMVQATLAIFHPNPIGHNTTPSSAIRQSWPNNIESSNGTDVIFA